MTDGRKKKRRSRPKAVSVNLTHTKYDLVRECITDLGWKVAASSLRPLLFWCDCYGTIDFASQLSRWQFYNHFPGMSVIAHKVQLARTYEAMRLGFPDLYNFHPRSFVLPQQHLDAAAFLVADDATLIVKPDRGSQGRGISIVRSPAEVEAVVETAVGQDYISPLLLGGLKFDMRIYVLVTSIDPLRVYVNTEGMTRFCTEPYAPGDLGSSFAHLTNFSLNRRNANFVINGHKRLLSSVLDELSHSGVDTISMWREIKRMIRLTLLAGQAPIASMYRTATSASDGKSRCFEILGFDILIDESGKPWLLEVNCMPSFGTGSQLDHDLKKQVISDALTIVDIQPSFKADCMEWFRAMSLGQPAPPMFDANRESELARGTGWRQLLPVVDDGEADSIYQTVARFLRTKNESRATKVRRQAAPECLVKTEEVIVRPRKTPKPVETRPKLGGAPELAMPRPGRIVHRAPPKSQRLGDEARLLRMAAYERMRRISMNSLAFAGCDFEPCYVSTTEEREREKAVLGQVEAANTLGVDGLVAKLVGIFALADDQATQLAPKASPGRPKLALANPQRQQVGCGFALT
jgi:tubulin polyglutamylase TTLL6/13